MPTVWGYLRSYLPMADDFVRNHIAALVADGEGGRARMARRLESWCWPGGPGDRAEPVAAQWLSRWRPARAAARVPVCLCSTGRCQVCN